MKDDIMYVFDKNFKRLNNLIALYIDLRAHSKGRKSTNNLEILRATVVLLHSTLEDYLRNLSKWKLIGASKSVIDQIPLANPLEINRKEKFPLGDLLPFKDEMVKDVIAKSIEIHLNRTTYNNSADIASCLRNIGVNIDEKIQIHFASLEEMVKRRHHIVHQADREIKEGSGFHKVKSVGLKQVIKWRNTVDKFVLEINKQIPGE